MSKSGYTAVLVVLDRSSSMWDICASVESSLAEVGREQAAAPGTCTFDLVKFSDSVSAAQENIPADQFAPKLHPAGSTALYDAIVTAVVGFRERIDALSDADKPEFVQVVVATDGHENASNFADAMMVKDTIAMHSQGLGWDFTFLGANQDAVYAGAALGFEAKKSMTFGASSAGVKGAASGLSAYINQTRSGQDAGYSDADRSAAVAH